MGSKCTGEMLVIFLFFVMSRGLQWAASASRMLRYLRVNLELAKFYIPSRAKLISPGL
jgi:hypothetical protein